MFGHNSRHFLDNLEIDRPYAVIELEGQCSAFDRAVACALAKTIHRAMESFRSCAHGCERVRSGHVTVVMAVERQALDLCVLQVSEKRVSLLGHHHAQGIANAEALDSVLLRLQSHVPEEFRFGPAAILCQKLYRETPFHGIIRGCENDV